MVTKAAAAAMKPIEFNVDGLTGVHTNINHSEPYAFFEFESAEKAHDASKLWSKNIFIDQTIFRLGGRLSRHSAADAYKIASTPKTANYGFAVIAKGGDNIIGQPISWAEDLIKCIGKSMGRDGVSTRSIPVFAISTF